MPTLPSDTLALYDARGTLFGWLRFAPRDAEPHKGECLFDILPEAQDGAERSEARWLAKRHYVRWSEHRFTLAPSGALTVRKAGFTLELHPDIEGDGLHTEPPQPPVTARWEA